MKRPLQSLVRRSEKGDSPHLCRPSAFTLVEMLVVISIIGILAGLVTAAAVVARKRAKIAVVVLELNQLDTALKA